MIGLKPYKAVIPMAAGSLYRNDSRASGYINRMLNRKKICILILWSWYGCKENKEPANAVDKESPKKARSAKSLNVLDCPKKPIVSERLNSFRYLEIEADSAMSLFPKNFPIDIEVSPSGLIIKGIEMIMKAITPTSKGATNSLQNSL